MEEGNEEIENLVKGEVSEKIVRDAEKTEMTELNTTGYKTKESDQLSEDSIEKTCG